MVSTKLHCFIDGNTLSKTKGEPCIITIEKNKDGTHLVKLGNINLATVNFLKQNYFSFGDHPGLDVDDVISKVIAWNI